MQYWNKDLLISLSHCAFPFFSFLSAYSQDESSLPERESTEIEILINLQIKLTKLDRPSLYAKISASDKNSLRDTAGDTMAVRLEMEFLEIHSGKVPGIYDCPYKIL